MKQTDYLVVCYQLETTKGFDYVAEYPQLTKLMGGIYGEAKTKTKAINALKKELAWFRSYVAKNHPDYCPSGILPEPEDIPYYGTATIVWKLPQDERIIADH